MNTPHHATPTIDRRTSRDVDGFTLVELLTVIAIIGVLVAILFPTISYARNASTSARCVGNLRQAGIAIQSYASDNKGTLPPGGAWFKPYFNADPRNFQVALIPYLSLTKTSSWGANVSYTPIFDCPAYKGDVATDSRYTLERYALAEDGTTRIQPFGFTYQNPANGKFETAPKPLSLATVPAKNVAIQDRNFSDSQPNHSGHRNALYFDWHVSRISSVE